MQQFSTTHQANTNMKHIGNYTIDFCLKLIRSGINKSGILCKNSFWEESDLLSTGYLALSDAIVSYDEGKHVKFDTYVSTCISNAIKDMNNKEGYLIRVPRTKDKAGNYLKSYQYCDLDEWLERGCDRAQGIQRKNIERYLARLLDACELSKRDRMVVEAKYGVGAYEQPLSTEEIAKQLNITTQSVNRICRRVLEKARCKAESSIVYRMGA